NIHEVIWLRKLSFIIETDESRRPGCLAPNGRGCSLDTGCIILSSINIQSGGGLFMSLALKASILVLLISPYCFSQDPMPVLNSSWQRTIQKTQKPTTDGSGPMRGMTAADKYFPRKAREGRVDPPNDPSLMTEDDRRAAIEKAEQESRMPKSEDA